MSLSSYRIADNACVIEKHGYIPRIVDRRQEADIKRRDLTKTTRRWIVDVCHSGFNRFRTLLVRDESSNAASSRLTISQPRSSRFGKRR